MLVKNKNTLTIYLAVLVGALLLLNLISRNWYKRFDLTDNKMYSLSKSSEEIVDKIDDLLTMKVYFSSDLPGELSNTKRYLQDLLEEYEAKSDNISTITGLELGATDYISKPFSMDVLFARVRKVFRETAEQNKVSKKRKLTIKDLTIDSDKHQVSYLQRFCLKR